MNRFRRIKNEIRLPLRQIMFLGPIPVGFNHIITVDTDSIANTFSKAISINAFTFFSMLTAAEKHQTKYRELNIIQILCVLHHQPWTMDLRRRHYIVYYLNYFQWQLQRYDHYCNNVAVEAYLSCCSHVEEAVMWCIDER
eukprot:144829_1